MFWKEIKLIWGGNLPEKAFYERTTFSNIVGGLGGGGTGYLPVAVGSHIFTMNSARKSLEYFAVSFDEVYEWRNFVILY